MKPNVQICNVLKQKKNYENPLLQRSIISGDPNVIDAPYKADVVVSDLYKQSVAILEIIKGNNR